MFKGVILGLSTAQIPQKAPSGRGRALRYIPMPARSQTHLPSRRRRTMPASRRKALRLYPARMGMPLRSLISNAPVASTGFVELSRLRRVANFNRLFVGLFICVLAFLMDSLI